MRDRIINVLRKFSKDGKLPADDESLFDGGYLDSFALTDAVSALEREFHITIPDSDFNPRKFESIERIETYLAGRV